MEEIETQKQTEMPAPEGAGFRVRLMRLLIGGLVLGLAAATLYLLAERNSRFYYLSQEGRNIVVYRGAWLPSGKRPFLPDDPHTARIYAPIELPEDAPVIEERRFEERQDLDRALFDILSGLAEERIRSEDERKMQEGFALVERASLLPGITGAQARSLRMLRAELSFFEGRAHLEKALVELRQAREKLELASEASSSRGEGAAMLLRSIVPATEVLSRSLQRSRGWEVPEFRAVLEESREEEAREVAAPKSAAPASLRSAPPATTETPESSQGEEAPSRSGEGGEEGAQ